MKNKMCLIIVSFLLTPLAAVAQNVDCSSSCPDGQSLVSFADGDNVTCVCQPAANMDATVANPDVREGEEVEQPS